MIHCFICKKDDAIFEIDHVIPFSRIKKDFLETIDKSTIPKKFIDDTETTCNPIFRKEDEILENQWKEYHKKYAIYQVLCVNCNRRKYNKTITD